MKRKRCSMERFVAAVKQHELSTPAAYVPASRGLLGKHFTAERKSTPDSSGLV